MHDYDCSINVDLEKCRLIDPLVKIIILYDSLILIRLNLKKVNTTL